MEHITTLQPFIHTQCPDGIQVMYTTGRDITTIPNLIHDQCPDGILVMYQNDVLSCVAHWCSLKAYTNDESVPGMHEVGLHIVGGLRKALKSSRGRSDHAFTFVRTTVIPSS